MDTHVISTIITDGTSDSTHCHCRTKESTQEQCQTSSIVTQWCLSHCW
uniref:Uncharacterized protein n=1 Tax=Arundo donax TaxID=35708 RepID=A0A0A9CAD7_ARUDO